MNTTTFEQWAIIELFGHTRIAAAVTEFIGLFDGRLVLDDDDEDTNAGAIPVYHSAADYFAANPEPQHDDADALTDAEADEIAEASAAAANLFLKELAQ